MCLSMLDLCVRMRDVISGFNSEIEESHLMLFLCSMLCSILCLMCSVSSLHVSGFLPFVICLSS